MVQSPSWPANPILISTLTHIFHMSQKSLTAGRQIILTLIPSHCESWRALLLRSELPAFVTNKAGTWKWPWRSVRRRKASRAEGKSFFPRTITPSMSKRNPKRPFGNNWNRFNFKSYNNTIESLTSDMLLLLHARSLKQEQQILWLGETHQKKAKKITNTVKDIRPVWDNHIHSKRH